MKKIILFVLMVCPLLIFGQTDKVKIYGTVSDYEGNPIDSANVMLLDQSFQPLHQSVSDENGNYSMEVPKGNYYAMAVLNRNHYGKTRLEYWAWSVPAQEDIQINPRYHKMEVYALNAFRPQGAHPSYMIYFRPMSLTKSLNSSGNKKDMDVTPDLEKSEIKVEINDENVDIYTIQKVKEYVEKKSGESDFVYGYIIQTSLPENFEDNYQRFRVVVKDKETGDKGEATYYLFNKNYETK